jgi:ATP-binding cassette subfamily B protein
VGVPASGALAGVYVLVVEDDEDARNIYRAILEYAGALVSSAPAARTALEIIRQIKFDVVLCDVHLGDEDALWLLGQTRAHQPDTPFIGVSGRDFDEHEMRHVGFSAFLTKPVDAAVLVGAIMRAISTSGSTDL